MVCNNWYRNPIVSLFKMLYTASCYLVSIEKRNWVLKHNTLNKGKDLDMLFSNSVQLVQIS